MKKSIFLLAAGLLLVAQSVFSSTIYVDANNGSDSWDGRSWATAKRTIQAGVDAADQLDFKKVLVAPGTYDAGGESDFVGGSTYQMSRVNMSYITLESTDGPTVTHIVGAPAHPNYPDEGTGPYRGVNMTGGTLSGFTIRDGIAWGDGGGVYCPYFEHYSVVTNCIITGNTASDGGGAYSVTLKDCEITHNSVSGGGSHGGGACNSTLFDCTVSYNYGTWGGGVSSDYNFQDNEKTIYNSTISHNSGSRGGGAESMYLENCRVINNTADAWGGGISSGWAKNCFISGNSAPKGGGFIGGSIGGSVESCTIVGNSADYGGGISSGSAKNSIILHNTANVFGHNSQSSYMYYCCTTEGPEEEYGGVYLDCLFVNPGFVNPTGGDYRLKYTSPCIDAGHNRNNFYNPGYTDLDGNPRVVDGDVSGTAVVDMGAFEYQATDTDGDGLTDDEERGAGLNPLASNIGLDFDKDGLDDIREVRIEGTDPVDADSDDDELNDGDEVNNTLTDPLDADSDNDALLDGAEVNSLGSDPLDSDTDDDGLNDGEEVDTYGTNPLNGDTDGDTISDSGELDSGLDPLLSNSGMDSDADGLGDVDEVNAHSTNPLDSDSDNDGLNDGDEVNAYNTNPLDSDSDNDGLSDGAEVNSNGTDPRDGDSDNDGIGDGNEVNTYGTDPLNGDTDGDGIRDGSEVNNGLNPLQVNAGDSDSDGLSDVDEVNIHNTDPLDPDSDNDGLNDIDEINLHGTDPNDYDSDNDGLKDGEELNIHGTDPLNPDSDDDGLSDAKEINIEGTDPLNGDTDGDTIFDGQEVANGLDPLVSNVGADTDSDTISDIDEVLALHTDPLDWDTDDDTIADGNEVANGLDPLAPLCNVVKHIPPPGLGHGFAQFGSEVAVDVDGDTAVVGQRVVDVDGHLYGTVGIYVRSGSEWILQQVLIRSYGFGCSVALDGDRVLVGANIDSGWDAGAAYIYVRSNGVWSQQARLTASDRAGDDEFGYSVSLSGNSALIGTKGNESAYIFTRSGSNWSEQAKLPAPAGAQGWFGTAVSLSGDTALIGAEYSDWGGKVNAGSAYIFTRSGTVWSQQAKLTDANGAEGDNFGCSVSLQGDTALIGSKWDDLGAETHAGSAFVFTRSGTNWNEQAKMTASDGARSDIFGYSVSLDGDLALVGARPEYAASNIVHAAYLFKRDGETWTQRARLNVGGLPNNNWSRQAVALGGNMALIASELGVHCFESTDGDYDRDGITDADEVNVYHFDPLNPDVDSDGLLDGDEVNVYSTDALDPDSDDDTILDGDEVANGLDPLVSNAGSDLDGDGLTDVEEVNEYQSDPLDIDTDLDGLNDGDEVHIHGTDPVNPDSDGDELSDGEEINIYLSDPLDIDGDGDGLEDGLELAFGTDPAKSDTDEDGLSDYEELVSGLDPLNDDIDNDGLTDGDEVNTYGTKPKRRDTDGDGLSDGDEVTTHGTNPNSDDSDGDGLSDSDEFVAGTSATNSASSLVVEFPEESPSLNTISWHGVSGRYYQLVYTTELGGEWVQVGDVGIGADADISRPIDAGHTNSFFQVRVSTDPADFGYVPPVE